MKRESLIKPPDSKTLKSGKVILSPGEDIGEHITDKREEIIFVIKGNATLIKEGEQIQLKTGEIHYIKPETLHNIKNNSDEELEYIYVVSLFK